MGKTIHNITRNTAVLFYRTIDYNEESKDEDEVPLRTAVLSQETILYDFIHRGQNPQRSGNHILS